MSWGGGEMAAVMWMLNVGDRSVVEVEQKEREGHFNRPVVKVEIWGWESQARWW